MKMLKKHAGKAVLAAVCVILVILGFVKPSAKTPDYPFEGVRADNLSYAAVYYYAAKYELSPEERGLVAPLLAELAVYGGGDGEYEAPAGMNMGLNIRTFSGEYTVSVGADRVYINAAAYEADMAAAMELSDAITELVKKYYEQ